MRLPGRLYSYGSATQGKFFKARLSAVSVKTLGFFTRPRVRIMTCFWKGFAPLWSYVQQRQAYHYATRNVRTDVKPKCAFQTEYLRAQSHFVHYSA